MAVISECGVHGFVAHSGGRCMQCVHEQEEKELKKWEKKPIDEKLRDLYLMIKGLGKREIY